jgi:chemotaxis-related protein WspD
MKKFIRQTYFERSTDEANGLLTSKNGADLLFDRPPRENYIEEWTAFVAKDKAIVTPLKKSVVIFRLQREWFALSTLALVEVAENRIIRKVPHHRTRVLLLGIVNLRGQLQPCISMHRLLGIESVQIEVSTEKKLAIGRLLAISKDHDVWVFPVEEVFGVFHCNMDEMENTPVTVVRSKGNYIKGLLNFLSFKVAFLDENKLFDRLQKESL